MKLEPGTDRGSSATVSTSAECASSDGRTDRRNVSRQPLEPKSRPCSLVGSIGYLRSTTAVRGRERLSVLPTPFSLGLPPLLRPPPPPHQLLPAARKHSRKSWNKLAQPTTTGDRKVQGWTAPRNDCCGPGQPVGKFYFWRRLSAWVQRIWLTKWGADLPYWKVILLC